jgi:LuxR family maltose regulon positive regulatory protein
MVVPSMSAYLSRLWLFQGRYQELAAWYDSRDIHPDNLLPGLEMEYLMIARMMLHRRHPDKALNLLVRLLLKLENENTKHKRTGVIIEAQILLALARYALDNLNLAYDSLRMALTLAKSGGYIRLFLDEGLPIRLMLEKVEVDASLDEYRDRLLTAFSQNTPSEIPIQSTIVQLTNREKKIAELIGVGLSNDEIAARLFVSPQTVKTHVKKIYRKLGVSKRSDAALKIQQQKCVGA